MTDEMAPGSDLEAVRLGLLAATLSGDAGLAYEQVAEQLENGVDLGTVLFELLAPMQRDVGRRWQSGDYLVADEHAATAALETVVSLIGGSLEVPVHGHHYAIVAAEGDIHSLPTRIVATYLIYLGYRVTNLGASVPAADLGAYLVENAVGTLLLTCSATASLRGARRSIAAVHEHDVPVIAGGRSFGPDAKRAEALGADGWLADPRDLPNYLKRFQPDVAAAEARFTPVEPLEVRMPVLHMALVESVPELGAAEARRIVAVLDAAELTGDLRIITELIGWYRIHADSPETSVDDRQLLAGLLSAVPVETPLWGAIAGADA